MKNIETFVWIDIGKTETTTRVINCRTGKETVSTCLNKRKKIFNISNEEHTIYRQDLTLWETKRTILKLFNYYIYSIFDKGLLKKTIKIIPYKKPHLNK